MLCLRRGERGAGRGAQTGSRGRKRPSTAGVGLQGVYSGLRRNSGTENRSEKSLMSVDFENIAASIKEMGALRQCH